MKNYDIFLLGHDKSYSITLHNRLTEWDILIRSIAYRDGILVQNTLILDSDVVRTLLNVFFQANSAFHLCASSEGEQKQSFESAENVILIGSSVSALLEKLIGKTENTIVLGAEDLPSILTVFESVVSDMQISQTLGEIFYTISFGQGESSMVLDALPAATQKQVFEHPETTMLTLANIDETQKTVFENCSTDLFVCAILPDIFYNLFTGLENRFAILSELTDIYGIYPLGRGETELIPGAEITQENAQKKEKAESVVMLGAAAGASIFPSLQELQLSFVLQFFVQDVEMRRYYLLADHDPFSLEDLDDSSLQDLSFAVL